MVARHFLSYFFVKKYLLVGASGMLWTGQWVSESVSQWVRDVCMSHQSNWIYYKQPMKFLFVLFTKLIVVFSLCSLKLITETDQWMLKLTTRLRRCSNIYISQQHANNRTWSQPLHIPTSAFRPLKYNCSYHRNQINISSRAANTHLIQNLI